MTRTYELGFVVEPRQNDDEVQAITDRFTGMIEEAGSTVTYVDSWGKRKLAYPIRKFNEGRYVFVYVTSDEEPPPWTTIERLMTQDEKILRYLVVRTDEDLKRAFRKGKVKPEIPGVEKIEEDVTDADEKATDEKATDEKATDEKATDETSANEATDAKAEEKTEATAASAAESDEKADAAAPAAEASSDDESNAEATEKTDGGEEE